jgi:hypothetical protein
MLQSCSAFLVVRATLESFDLQAGNVKFGTQCEEWVNVQIIVCIIIPLYFSVLHVKWKYAEISEKILKIQLAYLYKLR